MKKSLFLYIFLVGFLTSGCSSSYFGDRGRDFADCWQFQVRVGKATPNLIFYPIGVPSPGIKPYPGFIPLHASVRLTKLFQFGSGGYDAKTYGMLGRASGTWQEKRVEWGLSLFYYYRVQKRFISGNEELKKVLSSPTSHNEEIAAGEKLSDIDAIRSQDRGFFNVGFGAHIVTVGFDIGFDPIEFFDFVLGLATIDFQKDDLATLRFQEQKMLEAEKSARK